MSSAEVVAYMYGADLASRAAAEIEAGTPVDELPDDGPTLLQHQARERLGDVAWSYWVLRGSREALGVSDG